jgi:rhodanese-related sulfurtransferase
MADKATFEMPEGDYAGDVSCQQAWEALAADPSAVLIDVRTQVEWQLIGQPDLSSISGGSISREPLYLQWVTMQGMNENFIDELKAALQERDVEADTPLYFMCQSGGRSKMSAMQCTELGYSQCFNVAEGFEGDLDEQQHRNSVSGWKVSGLPWTQS